MDSPYLTVAVLPDPADHRTIEDIRDLLLERGARPDRDGVLVDRRRRMLVQPVPGPDAAGSPPVEILMSAGPLGDPGFSRRDMVTFARYLTGLFTAVVERTRPMYGGVGVEEVFPLPAQLRSGIPAQGYVTDPLFVRKDLLARWDLGAVLAGEYRRAVEGPAGTVFASWWPFTDGRPGTPDESPRSGIWEGGRILGRAVARAGLP